MILILMDLYIVLNTLFFPINVKVPLPHDLLALKINGKVYSNWIMSSLPGFDWPINVWVAQVKFVALFQVLMK